MALGIWREIRLFEGLEICPHLTENGSTGRINFILFQKDAGKEEREEVYKKFLGRSYDYFFQKTETRTSFKGGD